MSRHLGMDLQRRRWARRPSATASYQSHTLGASKVTSGWHVQVTRETDRVKLKNGREQLEKGSEMKNTKFSADRCKGLYSERRAQVLEHIMKSN